MELIVCAVRDSAADAFMQPWFSPTPGMAIRAFRDEVVRADSPLSKHPEDYELFKLGVFDDQTGSFVCHEPQQLARGKEFSTDP